MADDKKYYYLKLKENFFDSDEVILLESMQDGYLYSNILLKLYLRSLKNEGKLMFNDRIPYSPSMLAQLTRHNVGVVEKSLNIFKELGLIEIIDSGAIFISDIHNFIGKSSTEADRKREYRFRIDSEKGQMSRQISDKSTPEIELEIELDKDINKIPCASIDSQKVSNADINLFFESIWSLYPEKKGKASISASKKKELYKHGYDVIALCIKRYIEYINTTNYPYKNGSTFFNSGYIDYLECNYTVNKVKPKNKFINYDQGDINYDDIAQKAFQKRLND